MIKETCACGAQFEYSSRLYEEHDAVRDENDRAGMWRANHRHDVLMLEDQIAVKTDPFVYTERSRVPIPNSIKDSGWYAENIEWIWGEDGERVWVAPRQKPRDFDEWSAMWPSRE